MRHRGEIIQITVKYIFDFITITEKILTVPAYENQNDYLSVSKNNIIAGHLYYYVYHFLKSHPNEFETIAYK